MQHLGSIDKVEDLLDKVVQEDCFTQTEAEVPGIKYMVFDKVQLMEHSNTPFLCIIIIITISIYLILVGKDERPEKSASWAPWLKSSSRWVRLGQRWTNQR